MSVCGREGVALSGISLMKQLNLIEICAEFHLWRRSLRVKENFKCGGERNKGVESLRDNGEEKFKRGRRILHVAQWRIRSMQIKTRSRVEDSRLTLKNL